MTKYEASLELIKAEGACETTEVICKVCPAFRADTKSCYSLSNNKTLQLARQYIADIKAHPGKYLEALL